MTGRPSGRRGLDFIAARMPSAAGMAADKWPVHLPSAGVVPDSVEAAVTSEAVVVEAGPVVAVAKKRSVGSAPSCGDSGRRVVGRER
jgi:hypothetical protein